MGALGVEDHHRLLAPDPFRQADRNQHGREALSSTLEAHKSALEERFRVALIGHKKRGRVDLLLCNAHAFSSAPRCESCFRLGEGASNDLCCCCCRWASTIAASMSAGIVRPKSSRISF